MTATAWDTTKTEICGCDIEDCTAIHEGDILPERFAFWAKADRKGTYYASGSFEDFLMDVTDLADGEPFETGEAVVKDLATGARLDAAAFLARFA